MTASASNPLSGRVPLAPAWRQALLLLGGLLLATLWIHRETGLAMVAIWNRSETFAHAWVVPPISLWLIWRLRAQVLALKPEPMPWLVVGTAVLGFVWLLARLVAVNTAAQFALVGVLVLLVPLVLGWRVARVLTFPLGFLFFAVPAGDFVMPVLMQWTADVTVGALRLTGIPVYREGLQFVIPSGNWSVVEACSGVRYLMASTMVGTLFAYLNYHSTKRRVIFVVISMIVPILANWLRAYLIVMLGHLSSNRLAVGADHLVYGWALFGIVMVILYTIGARWTEAQPEQSAEPAPLRAGTLPRPAWLVAGLALVVTAAPLLVLAQIDAREREAVVQLEFPPELGGGWTRQADQPMPWSPGFENPSAEARVRYARGADSVGIYVAYYRQQDDARKLVSSNHRLLLADDKRWNALPPSLVPAAGARLRAQTLLDADQSSADGRREVRVWRAYWVDGRLAGGDIEAKLLGAWSRLIGRGDDSAMLFIYTEAKPEPADAVLARFSADGLPGLFGALEQARQRALAP